MTDVRQSAIRLYDRYTHDHMDRRLFMAKLTRLAGTAAAANALLLGIAPDPAAAALTDEKDARLIIERGALGPGSRLKGYVAVPRAARGKKIGTVLVVHENRGLNGHIEDVARRVALAGYFAVAPDFLSISGGTPADEDAARAAIAQLDLGASVNDAVAELGHLRTLRHNNGKVASLGFCWGGAFVDRLAIAAGSKLNAAVAYYGPAPDPSEAHKVKAAILLHYAGLDDRVNATAKPWVEALQNAGVRVEAHSYPGVNHAFNNDASADRYNKAAAELAWRRTLAFLKRELA